MLLYHTENPRFWDTIWKCNNAEQNSLEMIDKRKKEKEQQSVLW